MPSALLIFKGLCFDTSNEKIMFFFSYKSCELLLKILGNSGVFLLFADNFLAN